MTLTAPTLAQIEAARTRIPAEAQGTPLVRLAIDGPHEIFLKLENLQPIGSFKLRGASNAMALADEGELALGVYTASAGNMAQGVAWNARRLGIPCHVVVPEHAPRTKLDAIERLGGKLIRVPFDLWWDVIETHHYAGLEGVFVHPVCDIAVMAGNGTIGLEILEQLPDVREILVPYGGGGLASGIAAAVKAPRPTVAPAERSRVSVLACEVESAAPLSAALKAGAPHPIDYRASFVDGIGGKSVLAAMWPLVSSLLDGSRVVSLADVGDAIRLILERNRVLAEGAGAVPVAAALAATPAPGPVCCVVSGGNLDATKLAAILNDELPA